MKKLLEAYVTCEKYLQNKLPLNNEFLHAVRSINPEYLRASSSLKYMLKLSKFFLTIINEENIDAYDAEFRKLHSNSIQFLPFDEKENRIDVWYSSNIFKWSYPVLSRILKACMSYFHGPQVESSFNIMSDVIDIKSGNLSMKTLDAYQTIRYGLSAVGRNCN